MSVWVGQGYVLLNPARHYYRPKSPIYIPYSYIPLLFTSGLSWGVYDVRLWYDLYVLTQVRDLVFLSWSWPPTIGAVGVVSNRGAPYTVQMSNSNSLSNTWPWTFLGLDRPQSGRSELSAIGALLIPLQCLTVITRDVPIPKFEPIPIPILNFKAKPIPILNRYRYRYLDFSVLIFIYTPFYSKGDTSRAGHS